MDQQFLENLYVAFNERRFDDLLAMMHPDVEWENGMQGGFVHGRAAVGEYWRKQFEFITSHLDPLKFETDADGRSVIGLHITVRDLAGKILLQKDVKHIFTFRDGLIVKFEIADSVPFMEGLGDISDKFNVAMNPPE
jgi:ketosteroid isomerase-like protein